MLLRAVKFNKLSRFASFRVSLWQPYSRDKQRFNSRAQPYQVSIRAECNSGGLVLRVLSILLLLSVLRHSEWLQDNHCPLIRWTWTRRCKMALWYVYCLVLLSSSACANTTLQNTDLLPRLDGDFDMEDSSRRAVSPHCQPFLSSADVLAV